MANFGSFFYKPKKKEKEISAKRWNIFTIIGKAVKKTCTALGAMILISVVFSTLLFTFGGNTSAPLPDDMVLVFKIDNGLAEVQTRPSIMDPFPFMQPTIRNVIDTLDKAKDDRRVRGLVFNLQSGGISLAHIQELRVAIARFKESGKFTKIYAPSYMDGMGGLGSYYLASAFDEIWMQPVGMLSVSGVSMEMPFAKEGLDKLGVSAQFFKREEFKSAMENFTNSEISDSNKQMLESIITNLTSHIISDVSIDRKIDPAFIKKSLDKGLLTGEEALKEKLIDRLDYGDVLVSEVRKEATGNPEDESVELVSLATYSQHKVKPPKMAKPREDIALIYAVGTIVDTAGAQGNAGADEIYEAISDAYKDDAIKVIVLRVDSPGGSPTASETIRRAIVKAKEKGKKVIVSMGPVAASGGYWISTDADQIFALPGTLTGSIGVVMGKFEASGLWEKLGINWEGPQMGANADIWSINKPFDAEGTERMNALIDSTYEAFLTRVAEGRGMEKADVRKVAKGRAWTGEQAQRIGLVDKLGGLDAALDAAAVMAGAKDRTEVNVIRMPRELNRVEQILEMFGQEVSLGKFLGVESQTLKKLGAIFTQAQLQSTSPTTVYDASLESMR